MSQYLIILLTGLIFSACGFYMYIYFFSLGYGFSIAAIGAVMLFMFRGSLTWGTALQCLLFMVYGIRLGGYLLIREMKSPAYKKVLSPEMNRSRQMGTVPKVSIWISCALLYTLEVCPVFFRLKNGDGTSAAVIAGLIIMALGICLEMAADLQKSAAKKANPHRFCDTGLYKIVRCPNYFSEIMFWIGVTVSGIGAVQGKQWIITILALIIIVYVMYNSAQRLELRHEKTYGLDPEYQKYSDTVPILFPFTKHYHTLTTYRD